MRSVTCIPLSAYGSDAIAEAYRTIFAGSDPAPPQTFNGTSFERRFAFEHLDREASRLAWVASRPVGAILIARRGSTSHISGLGVAASDRRAGIARHLVRLACDEARARQDVRMTVEVAVDNVAAQRLYASLGYQRKRSLVGFAREDFAHGGPFDAVHEIDTFQVATIAARQLEEGLPWFLHPASFFGCSLPTRGFHIQHQAYAISTTRDLNLHVRLLFVSPEYRRRGLGRRLLNTIAREESAKSCRVAPFVPTGLCNAFFASMGFDVTTPHDEMEVTFRCGS